MKLTGANSRHADVGGDRDIPSWRGAVGPKPVGRPAGSPLAFPTRARHGCTRLEHAVMTRRACMNIASISFSLIAIAIIAGHVETFVAADGSWEKGRLPARARCSTATRRRVTRPRLRKWMTPGARFCPLAGSPTQALAEAQHSRSLRRASTSWIALFRSRPGPSRTRPDP